MEFLQDHRDKLLETCEQSLLIENLLHDIYYRVNSSHNGSDIDMDNVSSSVLSDDAVRGSPLQNDRQIAKRKPKVNYLVKTYSKGDLNRMDVSALKRCHELILKETTFQSSMLVKHLKYRDRMIKRAEGYYLRMTEILANASKLNLLKNEPLPIGGGSMADGLRARLSSSFSSTGAGGGGVDSSAVSASRREALLASSTAPGGETAFSQWVAAMRAVSRLKHGIPDEFRRKVWLSTAERYIRQQKIDWPGVARMAFNEAANPDDTSLGAQIIKDLHRTGCVDLAPPGGAPRQPTEAGGGRDEAACRAALKRVLLAFARWNKRVGYCQGFNVLATLILDICEYDEHSALKVMIFLVDFALPEGYFTNNLRSLAVDIAVFADLLKLHYPSLAHHLEKLQRKATQANNGHYYEPPLVNMYMMQWLLTLYATCLPRATVLRLWDCVFLDGSHVLLKAGLAIWTALAKPIFEVRTVDEFYSVMSRLSERLRTTDLVDADKLIQHIYSTDSSSGRYPSIDELRERYTCSVRPLGGSGGGAGAAKLAKEIDVDVGAGAGQRDRQIGCFGAFKLPRRLIQGASDRLTDANMLHSTSTGGLDFNKESYIGCSDASLRDRVSTDLAALQRRYESVQRKSRSARIVVASPAASLDHADGGGGVRARIEHVAPPINHLLVDQYLQRGNRFNNQLETNYSMESTLQNLSFTTSGSSRDEYNRSREDSIGSMASVRTLGDFSAHRDSQLYNRRVVPAPRIVLETNSQRNQANAAGAGSNFNNNNNFRNSVANDKILRESLSFDTQTKADGLESTNDGRLDSRPNFGPPDGEENIDSSGCSSPPSVPVNKTDDSVELISIDEQPAVRSSDVKTTSHPIEARRERSDSVFESVAAVSPQIRTRQTALTGSPGCGDVAEGAAAMDVSHFRRQKTDALSHSVRLESTASSRLRRRESAATTVGAGSTRQDVLRRFIEEAADQRRRKAALGAAFPRVVSRQA